MTDAQINNAWAEYRDGEGIDDEDNEGPKLDAQVLEALIMVDVTSVKEVAESPEGWRERRK